MSGWPSGHQPRKRGSSWMSCVRYGVGRVEHRAEHPVRARQRAQARDQLVAHAGDEEAAEAAVAVGDAERGVARAGQLARAVDEPLQHVVDRALRRDGQHRVAHLPQRGMQAAFHPRSRYGPWSVNCYRPTPSLPTKPCARCVRTTRPRRLGASASTICSGPTGTAWSPRSTRLRRGRRGRRLPPGHNLAVGPLHLRRRPLDAPVRPRARPRRVAAALDLRRGPAPGVRGGPPGLRHGARALGRTSALPPRGHEHQLTPLPAVGRALALFVVFFFETKTNRITRPRKDEPPAGGGTRAASVSVLRARRCDPVEAHGKHGACAAPCFHRPR